MSGSTQRMLGALALFLCGCSNSGQVSAPRGPDNDDPSVRIQVAIPRTDGTQQPAFLSLPASFNPSGRLRPLIVSLHNWGGDYTLQWPELEAAALAEGWIYLWPDFRGANSNPTACGSELAQQDILDAVAWAKSHYPVDATRIYLAGASGGGHMAMLMAGRSPETWTAVSAWAGISDLAEWYRTDTSGFRPLLIGCTGGAPGDSPAVDAQYRLRSPVSWLSSARTVPIDIADGIRDGFPGSDATSGSVPMAQSLRAFNVIATAVGTPTISPNEIAQLGASPKGRLLTPHPSDTAADVVWSRSIILRRTAGNARVTIFDGGHEGLAAATIDWLKRFHR